MEQPRQNKYLANMDAMHLDQMRVLLRESLTLALSNPFERRPATEMIVAYFARFFSHDTLIQQKFEVELELINANQLRGGTAYNRETDSEEKKEDTEDGK